ncbi:MAG: MBL fold metallo-hydrolase [Lachnospiraceae bacterium]|uniref:MBL fold metallo-hydrolase n=1 Tax=Candidatus Weimeria bifida TaxID=2599074 RepID=A0A6N7IWU6_9FIRM|nr:MBL fold metallo-hydrolase [Candidatus Weimeria bifida]RRF96277.1 MAG: MBL fold metallo-hydrolase [Lachnospiraceae bacterium]
MEMFSIASGSSGNCICAGNDDTHVMIDAGISGKKIEAGMNTYDLTTRDMAGILVTHEHIDHVSGLGVVMRRYGLPVYTTEGTIKAILRDGRIGKVDESLFHVIEPDQVFQIGSLLVKPIRISHDAADPVAYIIRDGSNGKKVGVITDLGKYDDYIVSNIKGLSAVLLEANHDVNMLEVGPYPYQLKRRILSDYGHLSNNLSGQLLGKILNDNMEHVFLGHLSEQNNYGRLALETVCDEVTDGDNPYKGRDFNITVASRHEVSERVIV